jgi:hypothetical protein
MAALACACAADQQRQFNLYNSAGNLNVGAYSWDLEEGVVTVRNKFGNETIYLWGATARTPAPARSG